MLRAAESRKEKKKDAVGPQAAAPEQLAIADAAANVQPPAPPRNAILWRGYRPHARANVHCSESGLRRSCQKTWRYPGHCYPHVLVGMHSSSSNPKYFFSF
ncbi:hypothetical protein CAEBREN_01491 [Caenorhabditis brenneri]|uniref:Uncharacterized protein n=1 Tax=Caenorhabditis brenneri TaxID=135651 RepID=G0MBS0_CAEBE|nr:hypothetical protein CAEBREN_01491 [Caenorhabditis brenneri]